VTSRFRRTLRHPRELAAAVAGAALAVAGLATVAAPSAQAANGVPRPDHVVVVIFENTTAGTIYGNSQAPYFNQLASTGAKFTGSTAIEHPSEPNYLDLFSGSNQGVTDDSCPHTFSTANEGAQLIAAGLTFTGYSEDLPSAGSTVCTSGNYARKHNPWVNFTNVPSAANQPFSAFPTDFTQLPTVSWVVPNLCDDMHDCSVATGDQWLAANLPGLLSSSAYAGGGTAVFVTWDEDDGSASNHVATLVISPYTPVGARSSAAFDHYSLLATTQSMLGLGCLGSSCSASSLRSAFGL
jgi:phosphatidylinositol-3-phosphatase